MLWFASKMWLVHVVAHHHCFYCITAHQRYGSYLQLPVFVSFMFNANNIRLLWQLSSSPTRSIPHLEDAQSNTVHHREKWVLNLKHSVMGVCVLHLCSVAHELVNPEKVNCCCVISLTNEECDNCTLQPLSRNHPDVATCLKGLHPPHLELLRHPWCVYKLPLLSYVTFTFGCGLILKTWGRFHIGISVETSLVAKAICLRPCECTCLGLQGLKSDRGKTGLCFGNNYISASVSSSDGLKWKLHTIN